MAQEWACEPHTRAKHALLRAYVDAWVPIIAHAAIRIGRREEIVLIDAFAGPGGYTTGDAGSPLILLNAVLSRSELRAAWSAQRFRVLLIEQDPTFAAALLARVAALGDLPPNVTVDVRHGRFEAEIDLELQRRRGGASPSTFAFIDPFGYSRSPMDLTRSLRIGQRVDTLTFVPFENVTRFLGRVGQEAAMDNLFGSPEWRDAILMSGAQRTEFLIALYRRQLTGPGQGRHSLVFGVTTRDGHDYRLFFSTDHPVGVERMKDAMWKVDPVNGAQFVASPMEGEPVLFSVEPDLGALRRVVVARFAGRSVAVDDLEKFVTLETAFRKQHLRSALKPLSEAELTVARPTGKTRGWPVGSVLTFR